jgi:hypothetical protein
VDGGDGLQIRRVIMNKSKMLKRMFGPKGEKMAGGWRILLTEELHNLNVPPHVNGVIKSRRIRWTGNVARIGEMRKVYNILVRKTERKSPLGTPRCTRQNNIKMDLKEIPWEGVDWIHLAQERDQWRALVNTVMKFRVS